MRRAGINRIFVLLILSFFLGGIIIAKLFHLQVVKHDYYAKKEAEGHLGYSEVSARRGEILIQDYHSGEIFRLATNASVPLLFADPTLVKDPKYIADKLAPLIFDKKTAEEREKNRIRQAKRMLPDNPSKEELASISPKTEEDMKKDFYNELLEKLSQKTRSSIILYKSPSKEIIQFFEKNNLAGIEAVTDAINAYPAQIGDEDYTAKILSPIIDIPYERLRELLKGRNRYTVLRQQVPPDIEVQIKKILEEDKKAKRGAFAGINFQEKNYRYYPEGSLAAQVIGFTSEHGGTYGIEQSFDSELRGKKGIFKTKLDATGQQVIVGDNLIIQPAIDGTDITLTIDRSIQMEVEKKLAKAVTDAKADSGLVIIMEPKTGRIISLAQYPAFDPNEYSKALSTEDIILTDADKENIVTVGQPPEEIHYLYLDVDSHYRIQIFKEVMENGKIIFSKFKNLIGAGAYRNQSVSDIFEPGSVFKAIVMSIALDDGDVTPNTTFNDSGPIKVDEFEIHNSQDRYFGSATTMRQTLEQSLNTGMAFVARRIGRELMYRYLKKFGFGERTYVEFEGEEKGTLQESTHWAESELVTYSFGQGIAVTPVQLITAVSALANKGILMRPHIVLQTESSDGQVTLYEPEQSRRVISEKTAATITAMMVSAVENGVARRAGVAGYRIAGKTGTAQTYKKGKPLTGPGTTIASLIGFAPISEPKFAVLVKIDRPRTSIWADATAAPLFSDIAQFLFKYYNIAPDAK